MAVLVEKRVCFATAPRSRRVFFSRCAKLEGKKYRRCNKQDYDPFRRAVAHSVYFEIYNVLLLPPAFTSGLTTRVFSHSTLTALELFYSTPCFLPSDAYKYCKTRVWSKACGSRFAKFRTTCTCE